MGAAVEVLTRKAVPVTQGVVLLGVADDAAGQQIAREVSRIARTETAIPVVTTRDSSQLLELSSRFQPLAILLDDALAQGVALADTLKRLISLAPVVLIAPLERQSDVATIVSAGEVDFVARAGNFVPLAVGLIERRLRRTRPDSALPEGWTEFPEDLGEVFRHEINNPLTGILGNAELLLSHRDQLSAADTQRVQTVVDLAVRLRETTRRLSNAWESHRLHPLKSA